MELQEMEEKLQNGDVLLEVKKKKKKKRRKKKRKREKRKEKIEEEEEEEVELSQDPLEVLGRDIMLMILKNLDARSVALSLLVSRAWHGVASSDSIWSAKCEELWLGKAHIPHLALVQGLPKLAAYSLSIMDGKRTRITKEDLCDHAWEFHFNKVVPEYWRNLDPYWKGTSPLMHRYFHTDGSQTADPGDKVWGGHECCYSIITSVVGEGKIREHYVRINRWPHMLVSRKQDWSWEMSNVLCCYSSVPDAHRGGDTGPLLPIELGIASGKLLILESSSTLIILATGWSDITVLQAKSAIALREKAATAAALREKAAAASRLRVLLRLRLCSVAAVIENRRLLLLPLRLCSDSASGGAATSLL